MSNQSAFRVKVSNMDFRVSGLLLCIILAFCCTCNGQQNGIIDRESKLTGFFQPGWFLENIPFIDLPDKEIEEIYYYRWATHKRHLRYTTAGSGYTTTEFVHAVGYAGKFDTISDAAGHHIFESRWLKDKRYNQDYINFWTRDVGNPNQYSEWIAAAAYENYLVDGDAEFFKSQLGFVRNIDNWGRTNYDESVGLYYISPLLDAMEYSCSSLPTDDGFGGGVGYRPSFNSEMYANMKAVVKMLRMIGDEESAAIGDMRAEELRQNILSKLWDPERKFFYHMMRSDNNPNLGLVDSREEIGFHPWRWGVPDNTTDTATAWEQFFDPMGFNTPYGPTTCEVRSQYYDGDQENQCCWWNGNSWPYSTSITLGAVAALIRDYKVPFLTRHDYFDLIKKYTTIHYKNDKPYVAECHSPERPIWVCDSFNHSEHYAHSTYINNVLEELIGIRPSDENTLYLEPLMPDTWKHFALENFYYHGHEISIVYNNDSFYETERTGLQVYVNGNLQAYSPILGPISVPVPPPVTTSRGRDKMENYAANPNAAGYPSVSVSFNGPNSSPWQAVDGRIIYDFVPSNRWHSWSSGNDYDWIAIDFGPGRSRTIDSVNLYLYNDVVTGEGGVDCPVTMTVQYNANGDWIDVQNQMNFPEKCAPNDLNILKFNPTTTQQVRVLFQRDVARDYYVGVTELEIWAPWPQNGSPDTYEAEDALVSAAQVLNSTQSSSGSYVGRIDFQDSSVAFHGVWADNLGEYSMRIFYANGYNTTATHNILVNNAQTVIASYQPTGDWGVFQASVTIPIMLQRGNNVIIFRLGNGYAELDKIQIL